MNEKAELKKELSLIEKKAEPIRKKLITIENDEKQKRLKG